MARKAEQDYERMLTEERASAEATEDTEEEEEEEPAEGR